MYIIRTEIIFKKIASSISDSACMWLVVENVDKFSEVPWNFFEHSSEQKIHNVYWSMQDCWI